MRTKYSMPSAVDIYIFPDPGKTFFNKNKNQEVCCPCIPLPQCPLEDDFILIEQNK